MILTAEHPATSLYRVEVSGWDDNQAFLWKTPNWSGPRTPVSRSRSTGASAKALSYSYVCSSRLARFAMTDRIQWPTKQSW